VICCGDSCRFPVIGEGCDSFQSGPSSHTNSSCFSNNGVVRIGVGRGNCEDDALGGGVSVFSESSFHFPVTGGDWNSFHSGGVDLSLGNIFVSGFSGSGGVLRLRDIKTMRGNCNEDATGGDSCGVILGKGGISHGSGIRSSEEGVVLLMGGRGICSNC